MYIVVLTNGEERIQVNRDIVVTLSVTQRDTLSVVL